MISKFALLVFLISQEIPFSFNLKTGVSVENFEDSMVSLSETWFNIYEISIDYNVLSFMEFSLSNFLKMGPSLSGDSLYNSLGFLLGFKLFYPYGLLSPYIRPSLALNFIDWFAYFKPGINLEIGAIFANHFLIEFFWDKTFVSQRKTTWYSFGINGGVRW